MPHIHYDDAFGVLPIEWHSGQPHTGHWLVLVEVWSSNVDLLRGATKPQVRVRADREAWVRIADEWKAVGWNGALRDVTKGEVRRWAKLGDARWWYGTIALEGWS